MKSLIKKSVVLFCVFAMMLGITACGSSEPTATEDTQIKTEDTSKDTQTTTEIEIVYEPELLEMSAFELLNMVQTAMVNYKYVLAEGYPWVNSPYVIHEISARDLEPHSSLEEFWIEGTFIKDYVIHHDLNTICQDGVIYKDIEKTSGKECYKLVLEFEPHVHELYVDCETHLPILLDEMKYIGVKGSMGHYYYTYAFSNERPTEAVDTTKCEEVWNNLEDKFYDYISNQDIVSVETTGKDYSGEEINNSYEFGGKVNFGTLRTMLSDNMGYAPGYTSYACSISGVRKYSIGTCEALNKECYIIYFENWLYENYDVLYSTTYIDIETELPVYQELTRVLGNTKETSYKEYTYK
ncbi:MAG: hypothetical protein IKU39_00295 [Lachnospiraceae bacterium]|nr:hypothetical protein [Lachnospiraceae bacterium]